MKIGIVNDLHMVVQVLSSLIEKKTPHQVAWVAYDGAEAVEQCRKDPPDLILMDLIMPVMDGVQATEAIMKESPCAILIVTSTVQGNLHKVFEAMGHGALDVVQTPSIEFFGEQDTTDELIKKIDRIGILIGDKKRLQPSLIEKEGGRPDASLRKKVPPLFAIGSSTGGPAALAKILAQLPGDVPFTITVIQHVNQDFIPGLTRWLSEQTSLKIEIAQEGDQPLPGVVYFPSGDKHLIVDEMCVFKYIDLQVKSPFTPSIDVLFSSLAKYWPTPSVGAILTGMGRDGAQGLKEMYDRGWHTIVEHKETCIVYGMPRAAVSMGAAKEELPLHHIADAVIEKLAPAKKRGNAVP